MCLERNSLHILYNIVWMFDKGPECDASGTSVIQTSHSYTRMGNNLQKLIFMTSSGALSA